MKYIYMNDFLDQSSIDFEFYMTQKIIDFLSQHKKITISVITGIFIYFRKLDYYKTMPRYNLKVSALIVIWTYLSIQMKTFWFKLLNKIKTHHRMHGKPRIYRIKHCQIIR